MLNRYTREHLVVSTPEGHILHFTVEGSVVRYGARIPTDPVVGVVTCLAWKGDWIVTGDSAGSLHLWDLKAKVSVSSKYHSLALCSCLLALNRKQPSHLSRTRSERDAHTHLRSALLALLCHAQ